MRRGFHLFFGAVFLVVLLSRCGVTTKQRFYYEPTVDRNAVKIERIAIVPNRLPLNITDPEKWKRFNWKVASDMLEKNGFEIVDYKTTVEAFERSGLPVEDTKSSRDKYAEFCQQLGVDAVIIPYYGTFSTAKTFLLFTTMEWQSLVTFQFYLSDQDIFISRLDAAGVDRYTSNLLVMAGTILMAVGSADEGLILAGTIVTGVGALADLYMTVFRSSDSHWRAAFRKAIQKGLQPFLKTYSLRVPPPPPSRVDFGEQKREQVGAEEGIQAKVVDVKPEFLLVNRGTDNGVRVGASCTIFAIDVAGRRFEIGKGMIQKIKSDQAVVQVTSGDRFNKGDVVIIQR